MVYYSITRRLGAIVINVNRFLIPVTNSESIFMRRQACLRWNPKLLQPNGKILCSTVSTHNLLDASTYSNLATSPEIEKEIKMVLLEYELAKQANIRVPSVISERDMVELLKQRGLNGRRKYFHFLGTKEFVKLAQKRKKEERQEAYKKFKEEQSNAEPDTSGTLTYSLNGNCLFPRISKKSIQSLQLSRLCHAATFELPLVLDMDFDNEMRDREISNLGVQLQLVYAMNRRSTQPFDLCLCNFHPNSKSWMYLDKHLKNFTEPHHMITTEEKDYFELYPKEKLVYLTPDAPESLKDYESDKIYIIGGLVDKGVSKPLTLAKAKYQGIRAAKLPIDKYLLWGMGGKSLTLDQMMMILLEWKKTNDWNKAFKFIPTRKLRRVEDVRDEQQRKFDPRSRFQRNKIGSVGLKVSSFFGNN